MEKVKLTDICRPKQWKTISGDEISSEGKYPVYGANGKMGFFHEYNHIDETLLIGCRGTCGTLHITEKFSYTNGNAMALDNLDKKANIKFLYYFLSKRGFNDVVSGGVQKQITIQNLQRIEIPLPSLATQQRIAAILDQADAIIQNNRAIVQKYDALTQSLFLDMFGDPVKNEKGWEMKFLGDLCDVGSSRRVFVDELVENGIPFYRGTEIGQMSIEDNITPTLFITEEHYEKLKKETGVPKIGDLLMPSICPDGRIFEVTNDKPFYFKDGRVLWIKVNDGIINSVYLKKYLKAIFAIDYGKIASGTTFAELKIFALKKINLHYPPIQLQNLFAERVAVIEAQKQQAQLELAKSEELFQSLLQRAFKGELN